MIKQQAYDLDMNIKKIAVILFAYPGYWRSSWCFDMWRWATPAAALFLVLGNDSSEARGAIWRPQNFARSFGVSTGTNIYPTCFSHWREPNPCCLAIHAA